MGSNIDTGTTRTEAPDASAIPKSWVVGIGASAGGLNALRTLFSRMPASPGIACVVVVHLSPQHESHLVELLQPYTRMTVQQVTDTVALERDHVYVIPPNANLDAIDTHLRLSELEQQRRRRAPIDHFLATLAASHDGHAVGVVLTGTGTDGTLGLRLIKEHGGLTIAQDPQEAEFDGMPRSAIETGMVDLVLPVRDVADHVLGYCASHPRLPALDHDGAIPGGEHAVLEQILGELRVRTDHEFAVYRPAAVLRRMGKRMKLHRADTLAGYLNVLRTQPSEARALADDLLLTPAEFFGNVEILERLQTDVIPRLFESKQNSRDRMRVWSIGCSTGEEAYSLAMLMIEEATRRAMQPRVQVFASDVSDDALRRARAGVYPQEIAATIPTKWLERFFVAEPGQYRVAQGVRDAVVFATHNLFRDPPYSHLDVIVCRDLLRDLQPDVRGGVLSLFHYALEPGGVLVVSPDDPIDLPHLFSCIDRESGLYRRTTAPRRRLVLPTGVRPFGTGLPLDERRRLASLQPAGLDINSIHRRAMERYAWPSVLIDAANQVLHYSATAGRYVQLPGGEPTYDILRLVREPIRSHLDMALSVARREGLSWQSPPLALPHAGGVRSVVLRVDPVPGAPGMLVVMFEERTSDVESGPATPGVPVKTIAQLQTDFEQTNQRLRALLDLHASDRRAHDETTANLLEANEEMRQILEELESSKEELQAVNEELTTLDDENRRRLAELSRLSSDLQHLFQSMAIATLFLDDELRIVRFTPQATEIFRLRPSDVGRPLSDLSHDLCYEELESDVRHVLEHNAPLDREVASTRGAWFLARIVPYRNGTNEVDGVVVSLIDISDRKRAEQQLREADRRKDEFLAMLAHELRNPLAPISTGIEVLKAAGRDPNIVAKIAETMGRQTRQLVRLVDDLLDVARISGGKLRLHRSQVPLADVVRDASAAIKPFIDKSGYELTISTPQEPILLDADQARLTQVLSNLLSNAIKFTPASGRIELTAERHADQVQVAVRDNGMGIPRDKLDHVFDMFYQGERSTGLGIGLTLAKSLVEMHGGQLEVDSAGVGLGSTFTLRLPIAAAGSQPAEGVVSTAEPCNDRRVLIVDDNQDAARTLSMMIRTLGDNEIHTAFSGSEALRTAALVRPDVVLLDLMMPEMDGYEVARRIRNEPWGSNVLIVALTGWGQEEHKRRTAEAGFDRHLTKPADRATLEAVLRDPRPAA